MWKEFLKDYQDNPATHVSMDIGLCSYVSLVGHSRLLIGNNSIEVVDNNVGEVLMKLYGKNVDQVIKDPASGEYRITLKTGLVLYFW